MAVDTTNSFVLTVDEARRFLDLDAGDTELDGRIEVIVNGVAKLFNEYTGRKLKQRSYTDQYLDGTGLVEMDVGEWPIVASGITVRADGTRTFTDDALTFWDGTSSPASANYMIDEEEGLLVRIDGDVWPEGRKTVKATYTAGIAQADANHLVDAALVHIADVFSRIGHDPQVGGGNIAGAESFSFVRDPLWASISPKVRTVLDMERKQTVTP